ncbi:MAG: ATP-binding protein [Candidatus Marinamargulisbacteria bacterium]
MWATSLKTLTLNIRYFTQLFLSTIIILAVAIGSILMLTSHHLKEYVVDKTIQQLTRQLNYIERQMATPNHSLSTMMAGIHQLNDDELRLTIISPTGAVVYDSASQGAPMDNHSNRPEVQQAKTNGIGSAIRFSATLDKSLVYVAKQTPTNILRLAVPIRTIEADLGNITQALALYTGLIFLLCLLVTYFMSRWISAPLKWTAKTIRRINERKFEKVNPKPSFIREINHLNIRLVEMADNISTFIQKISKEKEKKDIILNNMINGLVVVDDALNVLLVNKAARPLCFNMPEDDTHIDLADHPTIKTYLRQLMDQQDVDPIEIEHPNGKLVLLIGAIYEESQEPRGILIAQDITRLKRLESTRQKFVANVSHELKTPITLIRSMVETSLTANQKGMDLPDDFLAKALTHVDRLNDIIDDLLHLSKLETTGGVIEKSPTPINQIFDMVGQQCQPKADKKQIQLTITKSDTDINCNANLMVQALKNLVDNAIKYSPENTTVTVWLDQQPNADILFVKDEGHGIDDAHISKLFQRFYRVDDARSRQMGGTGLGLAIVKHIAQSHGGQAAVSSKLNVGTTFSLELPND